MWPIDDRNTYQIDIELETGEYFLKPREKEAKEAQKRKEKVSPFLILTVYIHAHMNVIPSSKRKLQQRERQNVQKLLSHLWKKQKQQWRKNWRRRGRERIGNKMEMGREMGKKNRRRRRKRSTSPRTRKALSHYFLLLVSCISFLF